eukprot:gene25995-11686_t
MRGDMALIKLQERAARMGSLKGASAPAPLSKTIKGTSSIEARVVDGGGGWKSRHGAKGEGEGLDSGGLMMQSITNRFPELMSDIETRGGPRTAQGGSRRLSHLARQGRRLAKGVAGAVGGGGAVGGAAL